MSRKRSHHQPQKKTKKPQNQTIYIAITAIIIISAIGALVLSQQPAITDSNDQTPNDTTDGTWLFAMDTDNIASKYQASAIPTLAIVDIQGNLVFYNRGVHTKDQLMPYIENASQGTADSLGTAPDFTVTTFGDKTFKLSNYEGSVVLIDLMAEYCNPCKQQMPELQKIKLEKGNNIVILSVDVAYPNESEELVRETFGEYIKEE